MKSIETIIKDTVVREASSSIKIDESHFFSVLTERENSKKLWSFIVLLAVLILCVAILISSFVFFINDVLLFENMPKINESGAIIPDRSCNRQSVLFLFNSAERWVNTGIQLQKGDEITISYSGGFHSDVVDLVNSARSNDTLRYKWVSFSKTDKNSTSEDLLYDKNRNPSGYFGSLLYVVAGEMSVDESDMNNVVQVRRDEKEPIKQNGTLYFSVNDIYLTNPVIKKLAQKNRDMLNVSNKDSTFFISKNLDTVRNKLLLYYARNDTVYFGGEQLEQHFYNNRDAFFNDNLGDVLVVIDIKRKLNWTSWRSSWYRNTEELMNRAFDKNSWICHVFAVIGAIIVSIGYFVQELWFIFISVLLIVMMINKKYFLKLFQK